MAPRSDGKLLLFPISKSTQLFDVQRSGFPAFSQATGANYDDLVTWDGFYDTARKFSDWVLAPFCALTARFAVELCALERGSGNLYTEKRLV